MSVATPGSATPGRAAPAPAKKKSRGRETAGDMIRSMGIIMLIVIPIWFFAQPPSSDAKRIRVIDPSADISSFVQAAPGAPVPGGLPADWRATSSTLDPGSLRIGWVTPMGEYAEYAASTTPAAAFLPTITGSGQQVGSFRVGAVTWQQYDDGDGHTSLVREQSGTTVVVGGERETTTLDELSALAGAVR